MNHLSKLFVLFVVVLLIGTLLGVSPVYGKPKPPTPTPNPYPDPELLLYEELDPYPAPPEEPEDPIPPTVVSFWEMPIQYAAYEMRFRWMFPSGDYEILNAHLTIEYTEYNGEIVTVNETLPFYSHTTINGYPGAIYRDTIPYTGLRSAIITDAWVWNTTTQQKVYASNLPYAWAGLEHSWFAPIIRYIHSPHY